MDRKLLRGGYTEGVSETHPSGDESPIPSPPPEASSSSEEDPVAVASDEEVLLACVAHLRRRRRLGWIRHDRRKELRDRAGYLAESGAAGYFWENPEELTYSVRGSLLDDAALFEVPSGREEDGGGSEGHADSGEEDEWGGPLSLPPRYGGGDTGVFSSTPAEPSEERRRRSEAARRTWSDPAFREKWFKKRWGEKVVEDGGGLGTAEEKYGRGKDPRRVSEEHKSQRKLKQRVANLPADALLSRELASLTEEEVGDAVRAYVEGNRRRAQSHRIRGRGTRDVGGKIEGGEEGEGLSGGRSRNAAPRGEGAASNDVTASDELQTEEDRLRELQRVRSERASKAYQTRLENERRRQEEVKKLASKDHCVVHPPSPALSLPLASSTTLSRATSALHRVKATLDAGTHEPISHQDVEEMMRPGRLGRRKDVLRRILSERYCLRGRCVPPNTTNGVADHRGEIIEGRMLFVTTAPLDLLGAFVVSKLRQDSGVNSGDSGS